MLFADLPPQVHIVSYKPIEFKFQDKKGDIKLIESHQIWSDFSEVTKIYRESGHNKEISDYLKNRLEKELFEVVQKSDGTLCATRGLNKEKNNAIILQAHMDMVAISADGNPRKEIFTHIKDGGLYANERTLGADNGIGVAAILAIAKDERFKKYPLEMIITTDEETEMLGARALSKNDFHGRYLINLDSEEFGHITKGCAGINQLKISEKIPTQILQSDDYSQISIFLTGARGGHSAEIKSNSLNPILILLKELQNFNDIKLVSLSGGERYNSIPRGAKAIFLVKSSYVSDVEKQIFIDLEKIKQNNIKFNPNFDIKIENQKADRGISYIDTSFQQTLFKAFNNIPLGLISTFEDKNISKTSQNLGIFNLSGRYFNTIIMERSSDKKESDEIKNKTFLALCQLVSKGKIACDSTPIWQPKKSSKLEAVAIKAFSQIEKNIQSKITIEHGGLESAIFVDKVPELEQISIGPTIQEPHSIQERVKIGTVVPFYEWLAEILIQLQN